MGGLNLYSTATDEISEDARDIADLFATHAALALGHARHRDDMSQALESRTLLGQATGLVMARYHLTAQAAFAPEDRPHSQIAMGRPGLGASGHPSQGNRPYSTGHHKTPMTSERAWPYVVMSGPMLETPARSTTARPSTIRPCRRGRPPTYAATSASIP